MLQISSTLGPYGVDQLRATFDNRRSIGYVHPAGACPAIIMQLTPAIAMLAERASILDFNWATRTLAPLDLQYGAAVIVRPLQAFRR